MIGNTDWRIKGGHNTKYMKSLSQVTTKVTPIPYDFDFAGFVGTHYSHTQTWTSIDNVKQREYLGYCRNTDEEYLKNIDKFIAKKEAILKTINSFDYLSERARKSLLKYIESFYYTIEKPKSFLYLLKNECRTDF